MVFTVAYSKYCLPIVRLVTCATAPYKLLLPLVTFNLPLECERTPLYAPFHPVILLVKSPLLTKFAPVELVLVSERVANLVPAFIQPVLKLCPT